MPETIVPEPNYDDPKEIFAFFGLAYYQAAILERGVVNLAVAMLAKNTPGVKNSDIESLFDSFDMKTFGQILHVAKEQFDFEDPLLEDLKLGLKKRNYLAHDFYVEHDLNMATEKGRKKMIDELIEHLKFLKRTDEELDKIWKKSWEVFGITTEIIEQKMFEYREAWLKND